MSGSSDPAEGRDPSLTTKLSPRKSPHQSREQRPPLHEPGQPVDMTARIKRAHVVRGLISEYRRAA
jgi:hypothetical protein